MTDHKQNNDKVATVSITPMMAQYLKIKQEYPDELLFYRMGDFYEMFFEDAIEASTAIDIVLTKRGKHLGKDIPMCGVPVHAADAYLARLIRKGYRIAVCEQIEDPREARKRGSNAVVQREVVRVVTPGTITEEQLLDARENNYLVALAEHGGNIGIAWVDVSTGEFLCQTVEKEELGSVINSVSPREVLLADNFIEKHKLLDIFPELNERATRQPTSFFEIEAAQRRLEETFEVKALDAYGNFGRAEISASGALVYYLQLTQKGHLPQLQQLKRVTGSETMIIDAATRRGLELVKNQSGSRQGSLLSIIDSTITGLGGRLLCSRLSSPLTDVDQVRARHMAVEWFVMNNAIREKLRDYLKAVPDIERAFSRLSVGRGGPRDLGALKLGLTTTKKIKGLFSSSDSLPEEIKNVINRLGNFSAVTTPLSEALQDDLPHNLREGGFIRDGYSEELDEQRLLRDESRKHIADLQAFYIAETGIPSLKIRHNNVLGYFIEVTSAHAGKISQNAESPFMHRQTLTNSSRFTTSQLNELETKLSQAGTRSLSLEIEFFNNLVEIVKQETKLIYGAAFVIAALDVTASIAFVSVCRGYVKPIIDDTNTFKIIGGRHPVVEASIDINRKGTFISNDCDLGPQQRLWLVTGPNMAGKSTFLRQNALIAILAQAGCFVPAEEAHIGIIDRLFSRVGAADDLARGRSTFMVEMVEAATILNQATDRSLVILDEIGRGTATFDGLSIAWATLEHLHEVNDCRTLFATHFHELTSLKTRLPTLSCQTMRVKEWGSEVIFLHEVVAGSADKSYGLYVAKLAGLPSSVVDRAREILGILEEGEQSGALAKLTNDLPLFSSLAKNKKHVLQDSQLRLAFDEISPDELTPREALDLLYKLKSLIT